MSMLVPLSVAVPLLGAAAITAVGRFVPGHVFNALALAVAAATTGICLTLLVGSRSHDLVYWFAGWRVHQGVALGIAFTVGPTAAALAAFTSFLATGALAYSWSSYRGREVSHLFYTLMLLFMAGMVGFSLTGDLFNLFVFFELMSVSAYALTGLQVRKSSVLEGALQFAVTNSIGAFLILFGIALLYGRAGALNLAQLGVELARRPPDTLVAVALALIVVGFLIKAGAAPFHFWLSDAYAVAPAAVAALLTGIMSDLGYHGIARVYWTVFSGATGEAPAVRDVLVAVGVASALVGGVMALLQAELKRLVAFATVANGGVSLVGIAALAARGLAGETIFVVAGGLVRAAAILLAGICIQRFGSGDELELHGRGRSPRYAALGIGFALCTIGFSAVPPFGPFLGKALVEQAAVARGYGFVPALLTIGTLLVAAALARATLRIFLGAGPRRDPLLSRQAEEASEGEPGEDTPSPHQAPLLVPAYVFLVVALGLAFMPGLGGRALLAAGRATDRPAYAAEVLRGSEPARARALPAVSLSPARYGYGAGSAAAALGLAVLFLYRRRLPRGARRGGAGLAVPAIQGLRTLHSGALGDYITWLAVGLAAIAGVWALLLA